MSYKHCDIYLNGSGKLLLSRVRIPDSFYHKAKGLLGEKKLQDGTGMLFEQCNSIHMIGMRVPLDILFLTSDGTILKCVYDIQPWRVAVCLRAKTTIELPSGNIKKSGLKPGMKLEIKKCIG